MLAGLLTLLACVIRSEIGGAFADRPLLVLFLPAVFLSAYAGGMGPGLLSTLLAALFVAYKLPPRDSFTIASTWELLQWGLFIFCGVLVSLLSRGLHHAQREADANAAKQKELNAELERMVSDLQSQQALLERMSELAHVGGWAFDPRTMAGNWTDEVARIHDLEPGTPISATKGIEYYVGESRVRVAQAVVEALSEGKPYDLEVELLSARGVHKWVRTVAEPQMVDGRVVRVEGALQDITDRRRVEEALRASEEKFAVAFAQNPAAVALSRLEDGVFLDVNDTWVALAGHSREEAIGNSARTMGIWPSGVEAAKFIHELEEKGTLRGWVQTFHNKSGKPFVAQLSAQLLTIHGERIILSTLVDISEQKRIEGALRESEERYRSLFIDNHAAMLILDPASGRIADANPAAARFYGWTEEELRGMRIHDLNPMPVEEIREALQRSSSGQQQHYFFKHRRADGSIRDVEVFSGQIPVREHNYICAIVHDITERLQAEEEHHRLEEEVAHTQKLESLGALAGGISHDMNNVLAAIMTLASMLQETHGEDPVIAKAMGTLLHAAGRGRDLVKGLTDFARKDIPQPRPMDINEVVRQEASLLRRATLQRVEVVLDLQDEIPEVMGDPNSIANALMNLCVNALDAMPTGGQLTMSTRLSESDGVEVCVTDTGEGMPPEVLRRAAEAFFTTKPPGKGTGLGMALVHGVMKAHHGKMEIQSEPGRGTEIRLSFPRMAALASPPEESAVTQGPARRLHVLLVDDDELIRETVPEMLKCLGHGALSVGGGAEALARLQAGLEVDLVVLDLNMPGMDGEATLLAIRSLRPELPVLLTTGYLDSKAEDLLARHPKLDILLKPFSTPELKAKLSKIG